MRMPINDDEEQENRALLITIGIFFLLFIIAVMFPSYFTFGEGDARALSFWWMAGEFFLALILGLMPKDTPLSTGIAQGASISAALLFLMGFCSCLAKFN
jgi:hypothetical protein